jgi:CheY-like chemotaxis protein
VHLSIATAGEDRLLFEVSDTGVGIEPEELAVIFEAFTQTRAGAAAGGSGLGLAISQHLIAKMGGVLRVQSQLGLGSRFFFDLPLAAADPSAHGAGDEDLAAPPLDARLADGEDVLALVADDSTVNRRILAALLESAGVRVISAAGGVEAIALAQQNRPNVVFMDLKMADLDGFEATRRLQADPATADIPVIAVTASAFGDTRTAALDSGCVDYLPKPVRAAALFGAMQKHLGVRFVSSSRADAPPEPVAGTSVPRRDLAARLAVAIELGAVTDLEAIAQGLMGGEGGDAALGRRIGALVQAFDFDGLRTLVAALGSDEPSLR